MTPPSFSFYYLDFWVRSWTCHASLNSNIRFTQIPDTLLDDAKAWENSGSTFAVMLLLSINLASRSLILSSIHFLNLSLSKVLTVITYTQFLHKLQNQFRFGSQNALYFSWYSLIFTCFELKSKICRVDNCFRLGTWIRATSIVLMNSRKHTITREIPLPLLCLWQPRWHNLHLSLAAEACRLFNRWAILNRALFSVLLLCRVDSSYMELFPLLINNDSLIFLDYLSECFSTFLLENKNKFY